MDDIFKAAILGIVEGITEFLPISSTGHLILVNQWVDFSDRGFSNMFNIVIQLGAILAVVIFFRKRIFPFYTAQTLDEKTEVFRLWGKTLIAVLPAFVLAFLFDELIETYLFNPVTVSIALVVWGVVIILLESRKSPPKWSTTAELGLMTVLLIGLAQCLALIPGTSRSAATIIGAMLLGASRVAAAEFSFFLAIPTIGGASVYALFKYITHNPGQLGVSSLVSLAVGFLTAFLVAWLVIAGFMKFISKQDFKVFGVYRIVLGVAVLTYFLLTGMRPVGT